MFLNILSSCLCYFPPETHSSHLFCCTPEVEVWKVHYRKMQKDELSAELGQCLRQPDYSNSPFQGQRREAVSLEKWNTWRNFFPMANILKFDVFFKASQCLCIPGTVLTVLWMLTHLILTTLCSRYYYFQLHFNRKGQQAWKFTPLPMAAWKVESQDLNTASLATNATL